MDRGHLSNQDNKTEQSSHFWYDNRTSPIFKSSLTDSSFYIWRESRAFESNMQHKTWRQEQLRPAHISIAYIQYDVIFKQKLFSSNEHEKHVAYKITRHSEIKQNCI